MKTDGIDGQGNTFNLSSPNGQPFSCEDVSPHSLSVNFCDVTTDVF